MKKKKMIILSGPSGSGKTTISNYLLSKIPDLKFSISCTTRNIRNKEKHGKDYYFISVKTFISKIKKSQFVEWEEVYPRVFYGTLKSEIYRIWKENKHILFDIDVKGGLKLKQQFPNNSLSIFIMVNSIKKLRKRLIFRNSENEEKINLRLNKAKKEQEYAKKFDFVILNIDLLKAKKQVTKLVSKFIHHNNNE
ncbi:guanylate kinase [Blattabacterium cuenoti]|uniref:guanylate kinase n=1 Tax=Blattabacterium cuenoti TaxID=1653831 RepID=UPI00163CA664|nr:guanylate kinase [Blattabacterium cuenoti]